MAGSSTPRGAKADSDAEAQADAAVEVSGADVEVSPTVSDAFEPVKMYHRTTDKVRTVSTLEAKIAAQFDDWSTDKPKKKA
jgi:hypothetical protein